MKWLDCGHSLDKTKHQAGDNASGLDMRSQ